MWHFVEKKVTSFVKNFNKLGKKKIQQVRKKSKTKSKNTYYYSNSLNFKL